METKHVFSVGTPNKEIYVCIWISPVTISEAWMILFFADDIIAL